MKRAPFMGKRRPIIARSEPLRPVLSIRDAPATGCVRKECSACSGAGYPFEPDPGCPACNGTGRVSGTTGRNMCEARSWAGGTTVDCERCLPIDKDCAACDGKGYLLFAGMIQSRFNLLDDVRFRVPVTKSLYSILHASGVPIRARDFAREHAQFFLGPQRGIMHEFVPRRTKEVMPDVLGRNVRRVFEVQDVRVWFAPRFAIRIARTLYDVRYEVRISASRFKVCALMVEEIVRVLRETHASQETWEELRALDRMAPTADRALTVQSAYVLARKEEHDRREQGSANELASERA